LAAPRGRSLSPPADIGHQTPFPSSILLLQIGFKAVVIEAIKPDDWVPPLTTALKI